MVGLALVASASRSALVSESWEVGALPTWAGAKAAADAARVVRTASFIVGWVCCEGLQESEGAAW